MCRISHVPVQVKCESLEWGKSLCKQEEIDSHVGGIGPTCPGGDLSLVGGEGSGWVG